VSVFRCSRVDRIILHTIVCCTKLVPALSAAGPWCSKSSAMCLFSQSPCARALVLAALFQSPRLRSAAKKILALPVMVGRCSSRNVASVTYALACALLLHLTPPSNSCTAATGAGCGWCSASLAPRWQSAHKASGAAAAGARQLRQGTGGRGLVLMLRGGNSKEKKAAKRVRASDDNSRDKLDKNSPRKLSKLASSDSTLRVRVCCKVLKFYPCLVLDSYYIANRV
jgi:hypothetical protein